MGSHPEKADKFGGFLISERLGVSSTAETLVAQRCDETTSGAKLVIKRALPTVAEDPALRSRFEAERALSLRLRHPNIVKSVESGERSGIPFWTMEFVRGFSLAVLRDRLIERGQGASPQLVEHFAAQLASALGYLHNLPAEDGTDARYIHGDIRPENVLSDLEGNAKLVDFGAAVDLAKAEIRSLPLTFPPGYDSPEHGDPNRLSAKSDVFSVGIILGELLLAERLRTRFETPPRRTTEQELVCFNEKLVAHETSRLERGDRHAVKLVREVRQMISREPERRPLLESSRPGYCR